MINRFILKNIIHWLKRNKILILKGARQVGKTTLLRTIEAHIKKTYPGAITVYIDAGNPLNNGIFESTATLEQYLIQHYDFPTKFIFLMIDEFQTIPDAGLFLKIIFDAHKEHLQLIVSGSSSLEITKNTEFLTGRALDFTIDRVTFREYIAYVLNIKAEAYSLDNFDEIVSFYSAFKSTIHPYFEEYLVFGGYPEVITTKLVTEKFAIMEAILKNYIEKDIASFLKIENISAFNNLMRILSSQIGNLVNKSELTNTLNISGITVEKYLSILEGTYVIDFCTPYFMNVRKEISKMPKSYLLDLGIKSYIEKTANSPDVPAGEVIENFIYLSIISQFKKDYVHFYRTLVGSEIDFIIERNNGKLMLCESKYRKNARVPIAFGAFEKKYPDKVDSRIIITKDILKKEGSVFYIPAELFPFIDLHA